MTHDTAAAILKERQIERRNAALFLAQPAGEELLRYLGRYWRMSPPVETGEQMLHRLGRLDALADLERLREEALKGT